MAKGDNEETVLAAQANMTAKLCSIIVIGSNLSP